MSCSKCSKTSKQSKRMNYEEKRITDYVHFMLRCGGLVVRGKKEPV